MPVYTPGDSVLWSFICGHPPIPSLGVEEERIDCDAKTDLGGALNKDEQLLQGCTEATDGERRAESTSST